MWNCTEMFFSHIYVYFHQTINLIWEVQRMSLKHFQTHPIKCSIDLITTCLVSKTQSLELVTWIGLVSFDLWLTVFIWNLSAKTWKIMSWPQLCRKYLLARLLHSIMPSWYRYDSSDNDPLWFYWVLKTLFCCYYFKNTHHCSEVAWTYFTFKLIQESCIVPCYDKIR